MKISKLSIEGFHNVSNTTYDFDQINYLIGRNGAGKSTVLQAIQLALLGYIPGTPKNSKEALFRHANGRTMSVTLELAGDDGPITISRTWARSNSSINSTVYITPDGYDIKTLVDDIELPVFNFNEFIGMTANKLKDWFVEFLPSAKMEIDWEKELNDALSSKHISPEVKQEKINEVMGKLGEPKFYNATGVDQVRLLNEHIKTVLSFYKSELSRFESTIQSLVFYDDIEADLVEDVFISRINELNEVKKQLLEVEYKKQSLERSKSMLAEYDDCTADSYEMDPTYQSLDTKYIELGREINDLVVEEEQITGNLEHLRKKKAEREGEMHDKELSLSKLSVILKSNNTCPYTSEPCNSLESAKATALEEANALNDVIVKLEDEIDDLNDKIEEYSERLKDIRIKSSQLFADRQACTFDKSSIKTRYTSRDKLKTSFDVDEEIPEMDVDIDEVNSSLEELQSIIVKIRANKRYEEMTEQFTKSKFKVEEEIECYKAWEKLTCVNGLQSSSQARSSFDEFESKMNEYIPALFEGKQAMFVVGGTANSFNFGVCNIDSATPYIPFDLLSSGEKCLFTLVLLISIIECSKSKLHLLLVDDIFDHLDDENVVKLFKLLPDVTDTQMIFAGVKIVDDIDIKTISIGK